MGEPAQAAESFRSALSFKAEAPVAIQLGDALLAADKPHEAAEAYDYASQLAPIDPGPCLLKGHALLAAGALADAIKAYEDAIRRDSTYAAARHYLAQALVHAGEIVRASGQLHYLLHQEPNYAPAMVLLGDISFHHGDHRQAAVEYCRAIAVEPAGPDILERLGKSFAAIGDPQQALKAYEAALAADATLGQVALAAAELCEGAGWLSRSARYYRTASMLADVGMAAAEGLARLEAKLAETDYDADGPELAPGPFVPPQTFARPSGPAAGSRTTPFNMNESDHRARGTRPLAYAPFRETQPLDDMPYRPAAAAPIKLPSQPSPPPRSSSGAPAAQAKEALSELKARGMEALKDLSGLFGKRPPRDR